MFKKNKTKNSVTITQKRTASSDLSTLIEKLQKNADRVEKNILDTEQNFTEDVNKINEGKPPLYQEDGNKKILDSLELLRGLDEDAANAARLQHPQAEMIEHDMKQLRDRVMKLREEHDRIYNITRSEGHPSMEGLWGNIVNEKQATLNKQGFAEDLPNVENQVEQHNIFHGEVEALAPHIVDSDTDYCSNLGIRYNKLLASSTLRQKNLHSLRDYMQRCTNELYWMDQQARERMSYDWSDTNLDYPARQRQYESFIIKSLEAKEETMTKLNDEAERLLQSNHPGRNVIQAHVEAVHADWKEYLNLLICEENHLKHMEEYHKFQREARDTQDLLRRLDTEINQKYKPDFKDMYQMEGLISELDEQAKAMDHFDARVRALQKRSQQVLPLKFRRETPSAVIPVEALCDYDADGGEILRGEKYSLLKNNGMKWDIRDSRGVRVTAPAVCFMVPPTDPEAVSISENLANQQKSIKQKISDSKSKLVQRLEDLRKESSGKDKQEQQCRQLMAGLEKVTKDLEKQEKAIYTRVRPPLEQNRMLQDSEDRLQELKDIETVVQKIEPEKASKVCEAETFLAANPNYVSAPQLDRKVDTANKKCDKVKQLLQYSKDKLQNSNQLENSLQNGKAFLSTFESKLTSETAAPSNPTSIDNTLTDLAAMSSDLKQNKPLISEAEQNLQAVQVSCQNMANKLQEHCPDVERQEAEVRKLNLRYDNLNRQIDRRSQSLQRAKSAYNNYHNDFDNLNNWLTRVPNYEPRENDDPRQVESKLKNQRNLLSDIERKESDLNSVSTNAQLYQQAVKEYETETETFKSVLDLEDGLVPQTYKRSRLESPATKVKNEESAIEARFAEVKAINKQRFQNLEYAQSVLNQQPEVAVVQQNVQSVRSAAPGEEAWRFKKQLDEENQRREQLERELQSIQSDIYVLEGQTPQDTIVKKELIKRVPDPQLDEEIHKVQQKLTEEQRSTWTLESELEALKYKLRRVEMETREDAQQYTVKEVLRIEKDREQEEEVRRLNDELEELQRQRTVRDTEIIQIKRQASLLAEQKTMEQEVIKEEEVIVVQNDPQLENEYRLLLDRKQRETNSRAELEDELKFLLEKLRRLEKEKAMAEEKISIKEVVKMEKDITLQREVENLRRQSEDEKAKHRSSRREKADLQRKIQSLEEEKSRVVVQEKMREIVRPDPMAENEVANLRFELVEQQRRFTEAEIQLKSLQDELRTLKNRGPRVEYKEIIKEVIKYKMDPHTERELEKLRNEIVDKTHETERCEVEIRQLNDEIQRWKDTKPQVQTKEVVNEVLQYREDPKTKVEVETLKRKLADEQKKRLDLEKEKSANEEKICLRKIDLSQVREKYVQQEVVKMEEDPLLKSECETFSKNINNEQRQKETLKDGLQRLQRQKSDLDLQLQDLERERRARRDVEIEIQRLRLCLNELEIRDKENREKVTVKQRVVLQQDPQQEKEHAILTVQVEEERHRRTLLEKELNSLLQQQVTLERMEVREKVVRSEKVQVEKDPETELEIRRLKRSMEEEKRRQRDFEQQLSELNSELSEMDFDNAKSSKELEFQQEENSRLQQETRRLETAIRRVQSEIQITVKETKHITESSPIESGGKNLELRLTSLQRELSDLKNVTGEKDREIEKLKKRKKKKKMQVQRKSYTRRSFVVIDPDTGKEMNPEEAYKMGVIDWTTYSNLQSHIGDQDQGL